MELWGVIEIIFWNDLINIEKHENLRFSTRMLPLKLTHKTLKTPLFQPESPSYSTLSKDFYCTLQELLPRGPKTTDQSPGLFLCQNVTSDSSIASMFHYLTSIVLPPHFQEIMSTPTHPTHHTENHQNRLIALQNKSRHSVFNLALSDTPRGQNYFRISLPWSLVWRGRVSKQTTTNTKLPAITIKINIRKRQTERSNIHQISSPGDCATPDFGLRRYERELVKLILLRTFFFREHLKPKLEQTFA